MITVKMVNVFGNNIVLLVTIVLFSFHWSTIISAKESEADLVIPNKYFEYDSGPSMRIHQNDKESSEGQTSRKRSPRLKNPHTKKLKTDPIRKLFESETNNEDNIEKITTRLRSPRLKNPHKKIKSSSYTTPDPENNSSVQSAQYHDAKPKNEKNFSSINRKSTKKKESKMIRFGQMRDLDSDEINRNEDSQEKFHDRSVDDILLGTDEVIGIFPIKRDKQQNKPRINYPMITSRAAKKERTGNQRTKTRTTKIKNKQKIETLTTPQIKHFRWTPAKEKETFVTLSTLDDMITDYENYITRTVKWNKKSTKAAKIYFQTGPEELNEQYGNIRNKKVLTTKSSDTKSTKTPVNHSHAKIGRSHKKKKKFQILRSTKMIRDSQEEVRTPASGEPAEDYDYKSLDKPTKVSQGKDVEMMSPYAIEKQLQRFATNYNKNGLANVTLEVLGRTAEYNNLVLLKITENSRDMSPRVFENKFENEEPEKKIIFIVHGLTVAGMRHLIKSEDDFNLLMTYYLAYLDKFDFYVIPMANPDGFAANYNSQASGYWNKNMSPQSSCAGVVLDRNFDVAWNITQKISPCSHLYPGPAAFSEPETKVIREVMHLHSHLIQAFIHVHTSTFSSKIFKGDAILYPLGYSEEPTDDDKYIDIKGDVEEIMKNASFKIISVAVEPLHNWYGKVLGTSVDYAAAVYGIPYAMEFAMQLYTGYQRVALTQIWKRVINATFNSIWKNSNLNEENRK